LVTEFGLLKLPKHMKNGILCDIIQSYQFRVYPVEF
jgi:hypothetical protein